MYNRIKKYSFQFSLLIFSLVFCFSFFININNVYAGACTGNNCPINSILPTITDKAGCPITDEYDDIKEKISDLDDMRKCIYKKICAEGEDYTLACRIQAGMFHFSDLKNYITQLSSFFMGIVGSVSILFIIVGAYMMIASGANEGLKTKGKKTITFAIAGLVLSILSWTIVNLVVYFSTMG